jgi:hypothetical protein
MYQCEVPPDALVSMLNASSQSTSSDGSGILHWRETDGPFESSKEESRTNDRPNPPTSHCAPRGLFALVVFADRCTDISRGRSVYMSEVINPVGAY